MQVDLVQPQRVSDHVWHVFGLAHTDTGVEVIEARCQLTDAEVAHDARARAQWRLCAAMTQVEASGRVQLPTRTIGFSAVEWVSPDDPRLVVVHG